jgi:hypothetical protein
VQTQDSQLEAKRSGSVQLILAFARKEVAKARARLLLVAISLTTGIKCSYFRSKCILETLQTVKT